MSSNDFVQYLKKYLTHKRRTPILWILQVARRQHSKKRQNSAFFFSIKLFALMQGTQIAGKLIRVCNQLWIQKQGCNEWFKWINAWCAVSASWGKWFQTETELDTKDDLKALVCACGWCIKGKIRWPWSMFSRAPERSKQLPWRKLTANSRGLGASYPC